MSYDQFPTEASLISAQVVVYARRLQCDATFPLPPIDSSFSLTWLILGLGCSRVNVPEG